MLNFRPKQVILVCLCLLLGCQMSMAKPKAAGKCSCSKPKSVQRLWGEQEVMFYGRIKKSKTKLTAIVEVPIKGALRLMWEKLRNSVLAPCRIH